MQLKNIATQRLQHQQLAGTHCTTPGKLVAFFGAMQAQDFGMARWAVGVRLGCEEAAVVKALDEGDILRTHVLRPTWHLVAAADTRWMLALTAPALQRASAGRHRQLELDDKLLTRTKNIITKALHGNHYQTREALMDLLKEKGIATNENRSSHILMDAELEGLICSGPVMDGKVTYALLDERVAATKELTRDEALAQLAARYFTSHGPATVADFSWWSGLGLRDAAKGINWAKEDLEQATIGGQIYWRGALPQQKHSTPKVLFLPAFDEFLISYKDRSASMAHELSKAHTITNNGIFKPTVIVDGAVMGWWQHSIEKDAVQVTAHLFHRPESVTDAMLRTAVKKYGDYLGIKTELTVTTVQA